MVFLMSEYRNADTRWAPNKYKVNSGVQLSWCLVCLNRTHTLAVALTLFLATFLFAAHTDTHTASWKKNKHSEWEGRERDRRKWGICIVINNKKYEHEFLIEFYGVFQFFVSISLFPSRLYSVFEQARIFWHICMFAICLCFDVLVFALPARCNYVFE